MKKYLIFILLGLFLLLFLIFFFIRLFGYLYLETEFPFTLKLFLSEKILLLVFMTVFMMQIISTLVAALNILFQSRDLPLLLACPINLGQIFSWKVIEVLINSSLMVVFFSIPALFAFCFYFMPTPFGILQAIIGFSLHLLSGVLIGIVIALVIPHFFSIKRIQPVFSLISVILISTIVIFVRLLRPEKLSNPDSLTDLWKFMNGFEVKTFSFFPFHWLSRWLRLSSEGNHLAVVPYLIYFVVFIGVFLFILFLLYKKYYLFLVEKLYQGQKSQRTSKWAPLKSDYTPLWQKEIKSFIRTPGQWSQLFIVAAIVVIFVINMMGIPLPHPSIKSFVAYLNMGMAAFIVVGLNSRFTFTSMPMEYPGIVHLFVSPFAPKKLIMFKNLFYSLPLTLLGIGLFVFGCLMLHLDSFMIISGIVFLLPLLPFLSVLAIFFSLRIEGSHHLTPQHLIASRPGISYMINGLVIIGLAMTFFIRPLFLYYYNYFTEKSIPYGEIYLWYGAYGIIMGTLTVIFFQKGLKLWHKKELR